MGMLRRMKRRQILRKISSRSIWIPKTDPEKFILKFPSSTWKVWHLKQLMEISLCGGNIEETFQGTDCLSRPGRLASDLARLRQEAPAPSAGMSTWSLTTGIKPC